MTALAEDGAATRRHLKVDISRVPEMANLPTKIDIGACVCGGEVAGGAGGEREAFPSGEPSLTKTLPPGSPMPRRHHNGLCTRGSSHPSAHDNRAGQDDPRRPRFLHRQAQRQDGGGDHQRVRRRGRPHAQGMRRKVASSLLTAMSCPPSTPVQGIDGQRSVDHPVVC